jgi:pimeloyl-ACP methyl ester carboxylesterase
VKPREISVAAGEVRLSALEYGPPDGAPLVLVHGIRDLAWSFDPVARAFAAEFRVLVPHLRGHGDSDKPGAYAMADLVGDLCALVDGLALERPVLVGHSLGGQIVTGYAGVFRDVPRALVVIEGMGPPEREAEPSEEGRLARLQWQIRSLNEPLRPPQPLPDLDAALERFRSRNPALDPARARLLVERGTEAHPDGGLRWKWVPEVQRVWTTTSPVENRERWSAIPCPVLVVIGAESARYWAGRGLGGSQSREDYLAQMIARAGIFPDVETAVVEGAGHMVHYEQPEELIRVTRDFLARRLSYPVPQEERQ